MTRPRDIEEVLDLTWCAIARTTSAGLRPRFVMLPVRLASLVDSIKGRTGLEVFASPRGDQSSIRVFEVDPRGEP